ncbi:MAG: hypothetical protein AB8B72_06495 [Crocinitomicaceae bacterium]
MKKLIAIAIVALNVMSCAKTTDGEWMIYEETVCYPFWTDEDSDNRSRQNLEKFLKAEGIIPLKIRVDGERNPSCDFCDCETGVTYEVKIDESQAGLMIYYGFKTR